MDFNRMRRLTRELIAIDSVTRREAGVVAFLEEELRRRRWVFRRLEVEEGRANLLAIADDGPPRLLFNTHLDAVPEQYGPEEDEERIYGRGACDAKGIAAAMLEALESAREAGVRGIGLLLVVGEERDHIGARRAGGDRALRPPAVLVVGEPTENRFMTAQKGILSARLMARGREGHSGYPERSDSAVERLLPALETLRRASWLADHSERGTTVNISLVRGGDAFNKVPGEASATLLFRLAEPVASVRERAAAVLRGASPDLEIVWEDEVASEPIERRDTLPGAPTAVAAFNTDLPYFGWTEARRYLVGPGSIHQAHRDPVGGDRMRGEWIDKSSQEDGARLYRRLIEVESRAPASGVGGRDGGGH
jgi:acetylornithine deacetylase